MSVEEALTLPQSPTFAVEGDKRYVVEVACVADEDGNVKGSLAQLEFRDARKRKIEFELEGWRSSEKYGVNRYVEVQDASGSIRATRLEISTPERARSMTLVLTPWADGAEPRLAAPVVARLDRRLFLSAEAPLVRDFAVTGGRPFTLSGRAVGHTGEPPRAGTVEVEYLHEDGRRVGSVTEHFESNGPFLIWLEPPGKARSARLSFRVAAASRPLALLGEPRFEEAVLQQAGITELMQLPQTLHRQVVGGERYVISGRCVSDGPPSARGALVRVEFHGEDGRVLDAAPEGWHRSAELGPHRHLPTEPVDDEGEGFSVTVGAPPAARTATVQFLPWAATSIPQLAGHVGFDHDPRIELSRERAVSLTFPVQASCPHLLVGRSIGSASPGNRMALVSAEYIDANGEVIPGPYPGFGRSPRKEIGYYQYVSGLGDGERNAFVQWIEPVDGSAKIALSLRRWKAAEDLALEGPPSCGPAEPRSIEELLEEYPDHERLLALLARLHAVEGSLSRHVETMGRRAATVSSPGAISEYRRAAGKLEELDTGWLPRIPVTRTATGSERGERICHLFKVTYPFENSGGAIRNLNTITSQREAGLEPYVVTPLNYPATAGVEEFPREDMVAGVPHIRLPIRGDSNVLPDSARLRYDTQLTAAVIEERGADIIHAASGYRGYELALKGLALRACFGKPLVYEARSMHEHLWGAWRGGDVLDREWTRLRMAQELRCMLEADAVVTIAEAMREVLLERGVPAEKLHVVPNAVDDKRFRKLPRVDDLRARFGLVGARVMGYVSNISYREGHATLVRAFHLLVKDHEDLRCLIVGEGPERDRVESVARSLGVWDKVVMTGEVDHAEVDRYYALMDIFVVPRRPDFASDYVTPLKPYEALALERPLVVSDRPSLREIVGDEERGLLFRSEDPEHLAARVGELLDDPERRRRLGESGRSWVVAERTWKGNAERYREIYAEVRERSRAAAGLPSG